MPAQACEVQRSLVDNETGESASSSLKAAEPGTESQYLPKHQDIAYYVIGTAG